MVKYMLKEPKSSVCVPAQCVLGVCVDVVCLSCTMYINFASIYVGLCAQVIFWQFNWFPCLTCTSDVSTALWLADIELEFCKGAVDWLTVVIVCCVAGGGHTRSKCGSKPSTIRMYSTRWTLTLRTLYWSHTPYLTVTMVTVLRHTNSHSQYMCVLYCVLL